MITFAGEPLLLETDEFQAWLDRYLPTGDIAHLGAATATHLSSRADPANPSRLPVGLGRPNYPPQPPIRFNSLYWPTGATRWSWFYGLVTKSSLDKIQRQSSDLPLPLVIDDEDRISITTNMYILPARPLSAFPFAGDEQLWLLPLVDERYWWQFGKMPTVSLLSTLDFDSTSTWADLFEACADALNVTITVDTVSSYYGYPDPYEANRHMEKPAVLLDAAAHSVGQRIVRWNDGTILSQNFTNAQARLELNLAADVWTQAAGGDFSAIHPAVLPNLHVGDQPKFYVPEAVHVAFRFNQFRPANSVYIISKSLTNSGIKGLTAVAGMQKTVHSTAIAVPVYGSPTPSNAAIDLDLLGGELTRDYYRSCQRSYDWTFNSIKTWKPSAYDDSVLWHFGRLKGGQYEASTRVQTSPYNFGVEEMIHQLADYPAIPMVTTLNAALATSVSSTPEILEFTALQSDAGTGSQDLAYTAVGFSLSGGRLTCQEPGFYVVGIYGRIATTPVCERATVGIYVNAALVGHLRSEHLRNLWALSAGDQTLSQNEFHPLVNIHGLINLWEDDIVDARVSILPSSHDVTFTGTLWLRRIGPNTVAE